MKRILLFLMLLSPMLGRSQAELRIDAVESVTVPVLTPSVSEVSLINTKVRNYAALSDFNDTLHIVIAVLDSLNQPQIMDNVNKGHYYLDSAGVGVDSVTIDSVHVNILHSYFHDGSNTVVIWPAAFNNITLDTIYFPVMYNSVDELIKDDINVTMGPNPTSESLFLGDPGNLVKQVRIRSLDGKLLGTGQTNTFLMLHHFSDGMYLIELQTAQKVYTRKLIIKK